MLCSKLIKLLYSLLAYQCNRSLQRCVVHTSTCGAIIIGFWLLCDGAFRALDAALSLLPFTPPLARTSSVPNGIFKSMRPLACTPCVSHVNKEKGWYVCTRAGFGCSFVYVFLPKLANLFLRLGLFGCVSRPVVFRRRTFPSVSAAPEALRSSASDSGDEAPSIWLAVDGRVVRVIS